ncbi:NFATC2-interacting protein isoform X2 [Pseudochaenichthys georgianus]|uniref:NFATC2-interacting protein isoform X2 n=1 Tax=Pseudochaenichthys georgianus TaxID=52239 RepID=UPI00146EA21E|nr:NFATC2-interacting protein [Pseudochaenichthys georgianus]
MEEMVSDEEQEAVNPQPKRRRILDPSAIISVPVYTNQVSNGLQLKPTAASFTQKQISDDGADDSLWFQFSPSISRTTALSYIDSEEDETEVLLKKTQPAIFSSPSPPGSPEVLQSRHAKNMINKIDIKLRAANTLDSPECRRRHFIEEEDDIICTNPNPGPQNSPYSESLREIPLKIRCMTHVHKIPVLSSTPLSDVLTRLSVILDAPPPRLMLLRKEEELPTNSTVGELGLGIADIIECVVMAAEDSSATETSSSSSSSSSLTVRLQSKDRDSSQEFSLHRDAPLGSIFSQYMSKMSAPAKRKVRFHFDGCKVTDRQTPAHLDMEDGDIIEVWT